MTSRCALALAVLALVTWSSSHADVPMLLNYQGHLTDASGNPETGLFTMDFAVFDAESGGTQLWGETQSVQVTDGVFNVLLGSVTPLPTDLFTGGPSDPAGPLRYLQVTVNGEPLGPRRRISSVAYAISAGSVDDISTRVYNSVDQAIPTNTDTRLSFDSEQWDTDSLHDETAGSNCAVLPNNCTFTVNTDGKYYIFAHVIFAADPTGDRTANIEINGSSVATNNAQALTGTGATTHIQVSTHYDLAEGDVVRVNVFQTSGGTLDVRRDSFNSPVFGMVKLP